MLILLPPSETKWAPRRGKPLDLSTISHPELTATRQRVLAALVALCSTDPAAAHRLNLPPGLAHHVVRNAALADAPTAAAGRIYTGVLYDALGLETLSPSARRRAGARVRITSSLFGLISPGDRIPAYRLAGDVNLPGLGAVSSLWRRPLADVLGPLSDKRLIVDLRSGMYTAFWNPSGARRVVAVRVLHESGGKRTIVSHFNKATKGRLVRAMLEDGAAPTSAPGLAQLLTSLGWQVEPRPDHVRGLDVIVDTV